MKVAIASLVAIAFLADAPAFAASVATGQGYQAYEVKTAYKKKKRYRARHHTQRQYWADKLPFGSQAWWQQMDREGRGGRRR
jgi:hypothetical protein